MLSYLRNPFQKGDLEDLNSRLPFFPKATPGLVSCLVVRKMRAHFGNINEGEMAI